MLPIKYLMLLSLTFATCASNCYAPSQKHEFTGSSNMKITTGCAKVRPSIRKDRPLVRSRRFDNKALNPGRSNQDYMESVLRENKERAARASSESQPSRR